MKHWPAVVLFLLASTLAAAAPKPNGDMIAKGKLSFTANCVVCHGDAGDGNGPAGAALNPKPRNLTTEKFKNGEKPDQVFKTLTDGLPSTAMASFAHLSEDDRWALTFYVLEFKKPAGNKKK